MATIKLNNEQLKLIQQALELYSRIGSLQYRFSLEHPSVQRMLLKSFTDDNDNVDYPKYHKAKEVIEKLFGDIQRIILNDSEFPDNASYGIFKKESLEALKAFDIVQIIRHEFWKEKPNRSNATKDSSVNLHATNPSIKINLDSKKEILNDKLKKIKKT